MPSVFLSYAQPDQKVARQLAEDLRVPGVQVWFDQQEILAGDSIAERIREGIRSVDYLIVLLSESSAKSVWVSREIGAAMARSGYALDSRSPNI